MSDKVILVTGASSGFGALAARALAEAGDTVYASMRQTQGRNAPQAEAARAWAEETGHDLRPLELDVQSGASNEAAVDTIIAEHDRIDVIVHNAGHMVFGPAEAFTPEQYTELYDVNVLGAQRLNRAALPHMRARRDGLLVWVGSSSTTGGTPPWLGPYFAAKAAMDRLAVVYAGELTRWGIETSIVVPGAYTSGTNHFLHAGSPDDGPTADAYSNGPYAGIEEDIGAGLAALEPEDADAADVGRAIAEVVAAPRGRRPFRVHVMTGPEGAHVADPVVDRLRAELLHRAGLGDLLTARAGRRRGPGVISSLQRGARALLGREAEGVADKSRERTTQMTDMTNESRVFGVPDADRVAVETLYHAFEGRPDLLDEAVTADRQDIPLAPGQQPGRNGMRPLLAGFGAAFPNLKINLHEIVGGPGRVAVRAEITGTHEGEWFGVAPAHRSFVMPIHEFHHLEDGRVTHTWHLEDWFGWLNQVGAWPPQTTTKGEDTMKAARLSDYNAAPTLEEIPVPEIGPDEVLVRVERASLNPMDNKLQMGVLHDNFPLEFPYTIGTDLAGTIERVGVDVVGWGEGDRVLARVDPTSGGALAELAAVPASYLARVPESMSIEKAAAIPTTAATAYQALFEMADLKAGQTVLVHAGTGGVGSIAIQFARAAGARVIATASGDGVQVARRLGADRVIDYRQEDFAEKVSDVDLVLDTVGGETGRRSFGVLRPGGLLLGIAEPPDEEAAGAYDIKTAFNVHTSNADRLKKVVDRIDAAGTEVLVDRVLPLDSLDEAFARQGSGRARGKILLTP